MDETLIAIGLGLFSAVTLAAANMSVKLGTDILVGRAILSTSAALMVLPAAFLVDPPDAATAAALALAVPAHFSTNCAWSRRWAGATYRWSSR